LAVEIVTSPVSFPLAITDDEPDQGDEDYGEPDGDEQDGFVEDEIDHMAVTGDIQRTIEHPPYLL